MVRARALAPARQDQGGILLDRSTARAEGRASGIAPTLGDYARTVYRRKWLALTCLMAGLGLGASVLPATLPNQGSYQTTVRLKVAQPVSDTIVRERPQFETAPSGGEGNALQDVVLADEVLRKLGGRAGGLTAPELVATLTANPVAGSSFVDLAYVDTDKARAGRVAAAYAKAWVARRNAIDAKRMEAATLALDRQVEELKGSTAGLDATASEAQKAELSRAQARLGTLVGLRDSIGQQRLFLGAPTAVLGTPVTTQLSAPTPLALVIVLGLLIGLIAGVGLALLAEAARPKVLAPADVEHATGEPVIASVAPGGIRSRLPVAERPFSPAAEGYRRVAGALERRGLGDDVRVLAVVSADRREGRTLLAANLAHLLARQGRDVLLVSADLRRPELDDVIGVGSEPGLAEWLEDPEDAGELPMQLVADHLLALPAGKTQRSPGELLTARRLRQCLEPVAQSGFIVVIDTPPALSSAEAITLSAVSDATLLVARAGTSRWGAIANLAEVLRRDGIRAIGTVLVGDRGEASSLALRNGLGYAGRHQAGARRRMDLGPTPERPAPSWPSDDADVDAEPTPALRGGPGRRRR